MPLYSCQIGKNYKAREHQVLVRSVNWVAILSNNFSVLSELTIHLPNNLVSGYIHALEKFAQGYNNTCIRMSTIVLLVTTQTLMFLYDNHSRNGQANCVLCHTLTLGHSGKLIRLCRATWRDVKNILLSGRKEGFWPQTIYVN